MCRPWNIVLICYFCINSAVCMDRLLEFLNDKIDQEIINKLDIRTLYNQNLNISEQYINKFIEEFQAGEEDEDVHLTIPQIIRKNGHQVEEHTVVTSDGRTLSVVRIPGKGPPVFLMHGLTSSSDDWVTCVHEASLPFLLAERNFDVWMGNSRGVKNLLENENNIPKEEYWDFSWHEIGIYDVPSMIDYTLEKTNQKSLIYIGHSQGTTAFYVMCSLRPEYNDKVSLMISLSAVAWSHMKSPIIQLLKPLGNELYRFSKASGVYDLLEWVKYLNRLVCKNIIDSDIVCKNMLFIFTGFSFQTSIRRYPVIFQYNPTPVSVKQVVHFLQLVKSGRFQQFDYEGENILIYGSPEPPSYPVENIKVPIAIFLGDEDWLSSKTDVEILASKLPNLVELYEMPIELYNHVDFVFADANKFLLFPKILALIEKYSLNL